MNKDKNDPIIIVKKKSDHSGGGHGGAWKVAFADFAIAMMAFFLLLWLLSSTTQDEKEQISNYFNDPVEHMKNINRPLVVQVVGDAKSSGEPLGKDKMRTLNEESIRETYSELEREKMESLRQLLTKSIRQNKTLKKYRNQIYLDITEEGLRIQILDAQKKALFNRSSAQISEDFSALLRDLVFMINYVDNRISIVGHTDAKPFKFKEMTNWELSSQRANAARRVLVNAGVDEARIARVVGLGSTILFDEKKPFSAVNRRITITILNKDADILAIEREKKLNRSLVESKSPNQD